MSENDETSCEEVPQNDGDSQVSNICDADMEEVSGCTVPEHMTSDSSEDGLASEKRDEEQTENEKEHKGRTEDSVDVVAIPYINDGNSNAQLFFKSMFLKTDDTPGGAALYSAERYFFEKFEDDDEPKWDGVLVCLYNFTRSVIVKNDSNAFITKRDFVSKWLWRNTGSREDVTFNVKCTMPKVWASHFQSFLKRMEWYGKLGHSGQIAFYSDGDGNYRPKFKFSKEFEEVDGIPSYRIESKAEELFDAG